MTTIKAYVKNKDRWQLEVLLGFWRKSLLTARICAMLIFCYFPMRNSPWLGNLGKIFLNYHFHVNFGSVIFLSDSSPEAMNVCVRDLEGQGHDITKHCGLSSALNFAKSHHMFSYLPSSLSSWPMDRPWLAERTIDEVWVGGTIPQHGPCLISWLIFYFSIYWE